MEPVTVPTAHEAPSPHLLSSHSASTSLLTHELKRQANVLSSPSLKQSTSQSAAGLNAVDPNQARSKSVIAASKASPLSLQTETESPELGPISSSAPHHSLSPLALNASSGTANIGSAHATSAASPILNRSDSKGAAIRSHNPSKIGMVAYSEGARDDYDPDQYPIYRHQVSGHFPMLWNSAGRICKPASERELEFYQNLNQKFPALLPFVPRFYGMMKISNVSGPDDDSKSSDHSNSGSSSTNNNHGTSHSANDALAPLDSPSVSVSASESSDLRQSLSPSTTLTPPITASSAPATGSSPISFSLPNNASALDSSPPPPSEFPAPPEESIDSATAQNPPQPIKRKKSKKHSNGWAFKCHEKRSDQLNHRTIPYLVLEDLNKVFHKPSILDIKLGTQQHSVDDPPSKIASKRLKCASTTSAAFGLRFCGSQIWHPNDESYTYRDKYYGRKLDGAGLVMALRDFFFNGHRVRSDVVETVLYRVRQFRAVMEHQTAFQFRSSSLLIIYEGNIASPTDVSVKYGSVLAKSPSPLSTASGLASPSAAASPPPSAPVSFSLPSSSSPPTTETPSSPKPPNWNPFIGFSDVRLIDFAHIDTNLGERDVGVLLGLDNLIQMLQMILKDDSVENTIVAGALTVNPETPIVPGVAGPVPALNGDSGKDGTADLRSKLL